MILLTHLQLSQTAFENLSNKYESMKGFPHSSQNNFSDESNRAPKKIDSSGTTSISRGYRTLTVQCQTEQPVCNYY